MPELGRRHFILGAASAVGGGLIVGCAKPDRESRVQSFVLAPEQALQGEDVWFATADAAAGWGNSVVVRTIDGRAKKVEGNPEFPINRGKAHVRSQAGVQSLYHPDRLQTPMRRRGDRGSADFEQITWDEALDILIENLQPPRTPLIITGRIAGTKGWVTRSFAEMLGGRHLVFEPMETTALDEGVRRIFGTEETPHFDLANAGYVLSFGADFLGTWLSPVQYSLAYSSFRHGAGRERGLFTQIEPRMSMTGSNADRWLYINPGHEGAVALSIARTIVDEGLVAESVWNDPLGAAGGRQALDAYSPESVAATAGIGADMIRTVAREFALHLPGIAIPGGPALAQTNGADIASAVLLLNRIVGSDGTVGGVLPNPAAPERHPKPIAADPFREFARLASDGGAADAIIVHDVDPVYGLPSSVGFSDVISRAGFVASMTTFMNETSAYADLLLPATHPFEEWGSFAADPADGRQVIGFQQPVVSSWTDARSFGDLLLAIAPELIGAQAFRAQTMHETVKASAIEQFGDADPAKSPEENWVELLRSGGIWEATESEGRFSDEIDWSLSSLKAPEYVGDTGEYRFNLMPFETISSGNGSEAVNPWLQAAPDPLTTVTWTTWVEINPQTAVELDLKRGDVVDVVTPMGSISAGIYESPVVPPDVIGVPVGGGRKYGGRWDVGQGSNVLSILGARLDESTGALAWAATRARLVKTGENSDLPTFEFFDDPRNDEGGAPVKVTDE